MIKLKMKNVFYVIAFVLLVFVMVGCAKKREEVTKNEETKAYKVGDKLENLVKNSDFAASTDGWILDGAVKLNTEVSRKTTDTNSLRFTGYGFALYKMNNVPAGKYSLRYFLYDSGNIKRAEMAVFVNGTQVIAFDYCQRGWWQEFASEAIDVPENASVSIKLTVDGEGDMALDLDEVYFVKVPYDEAPEPYKSEKAISQLVKRKDGTYYMTVNGKPFIWQAAHAATNSSATLDEIVLKIKEAGCNVFSYTVSWNELQPEADENFNYTMLDELLSIAKKYNMYVDIVWGGAGYCGNSEKVPEYIKNLHTVHSKNANGECETMAIDNEGKNFKCICDYGNEMLLKLENKAFSAMISYLEQNDTENLVISVQIENEAAESLYNSVSLTYEDLAKHIDYLGQTVKKSKHSMLVRVNQGFGSAPHFVFNTEYIDFNGTDPYTENIYNIRRTVTDEFNSRIGNLSENGGFDTSTAQLCIAYAENGYVSIYPVDRDVYWDRPGLYGLNFAVLEYTTDITNLNKAVSQIAEILAKAPKASKDSFNTAITGQLSDPCDIKKIKGINIKFEAMESNGAVGIAVVDKNYIYCVADKEAYFSVFGTDVKAEVCKVGTSGELEKVRDVNLQDAKDGSFRADYSIDTVLRFSVKKSIEPIEGAVALDPIIDVSAVAAIDAPIGQNLIPNPSFEEGLGEWKIKTDCEVNHADSDGCAPDDGGKYSVNFWNDTVARGNTTFSYNVGVVPAGSYSFSFKIRGGQYGDKSFKVAIYGNGAIISEKYITGIDNNFNEHTLVTNLADKTKIKITFILENEMDGAWSYMDTVNFSRIN